MRRTANPVFAGSIPAPASKLIRVIAPHFVAGFETDGVVIRAAPIMKYMVGWTDEKTRSYILKKGWTATVCNVLQKR